MNADLERVETQLLKLETTLLNLENALEQLTLDSLAIEDKLEQDSNLVACMQLTVNEFRRGR